MTASCCLLFSIFCLSFVLFPVAVHASGATEGKNNTIAFQIELPGIGKTLNINPALLGIYLINLYKYLIGSIGILAALVLMWGGLMWLTAGGNNARVGEAKKWISAALTGLILALCSVVILFTINPALVTPANLKIPAPVEIKTQEKTDEKTNLQKTKENEDGCCANTANTECVSSKREDCVGGKVFHSGLSCTNTGSSWWPKQECK